MTRFLSLREVLLLHERIAAQSGGGIGVRDLGLLESALAQPRQSFGGADLYPTIPEKAVALGFSLISNHPFVDGNKRVGHAALEIFLFLNGFELRADVDDQERVVLAVAAGAMGRDDLLHWVRRHIFTLED
ncbi:MAG: type II toxin-antitoxin system death-on-curing family toxin [Proteobacteria bacterium]|nr:type II toxin-antitoxin system death-on-curing family toxin [Pseudomonadota bacterium]